MIRNVEIRGRRGLDCVITHGAITEIAVGLPGLKGDVEIDGAGGALLPGLADHHLHLLAMAAAASSVDLATATDLDATLVEAAGHGAWVRAVGYDDGAHGPLDLQRLDACAPRTPIRVQHRSGALWVVNSEAARILGPDGLTGSGAEYDGAGVFTGRLWRADDVFRTLRETPPDLAETGRKLAAYGLTHVSDATPDDDGSAARLLAEAVRTGALPQHVQVMGAASPDSALSLGPRKIVVTDHALPGLDELAECVRAGHSAGRAVAVHCVTRAALLLTLAAFDDGGVRPGDRVEHCAVADHGSVERIAAMGLAVVTQPTLIAVRGDDYLSRCDPEDHGDLWRHGSLIRAGVRVGLSSDAPYGDPDPWACIRAAVNRRTASGSTIGVDERVTPRRALAGLLAPLHRPGGTPRALAQGAPADAVLLDRPLDHALREPSAEHVRCTIVSGVPVYRRD
jgi:predicted amidohydrolase YtcJ